MARDDSGGAGGRKEVRGKEMLKKLWIRLLLGNGKELYDSLEIRGCLYIIDIHIYEPAEKLIDRMEKALQEQGQTSRQVSESEDIGVEDRMDEGRMNFEHVDELINFLAEDIKKRVAEDIGIDSAIKETKAISMLIAARSLGLNEQLINTINANLDNLVKKYVQERIHGEFYRGWEGVEK